MKFLREIIIIDYADTTGLSYHYYEKYAHYIYIVTYCLAS